MSDHGHRILATYLNDHLAGSVAAIELLDHLRERSKGTERERLFSSLQSEIEEDQKVLKVLRGVGGKESRVRKAAAWLTEKVGEAKLKLADSGGGELKLLEALEQRAKEQHDRMETERLKVARAASGT